MKRFLVIAVLIVFGGSALTALAGWSYGELVAQRPSVRDEQAPANEHDRDEASAEKCKAAQIHKPATPAEREKQAAACTQEAKSERINEDSLTQTARSAHAAEESAAILFVQTEIGLIGTGLLAITVAASIYAADATNRTLRDAQWTSERELRAYVFVHEARIKAVDSGGHFIRYGYRNTGSTPAKNVRVRVRAIIAPKGAPIDFEDLGPEKNIGPLGPRDERMGDEAIDACRDAIAYGDAHGLESLEVRFYGRIDYGDEFSPNRWTTFNCVHPGPATHGKTLHTAEGHNDYE